MIDYTVSVSEGWPLVQLEDRVSDERLGKALRTIGPNLGALFESNRVLESMPWQKIIISVSLGWGGPAEKFRAYDVRPKSWLELTLSADLLAFRPLSMEEMVAELKDAVIIAFHETCLRRGIENPALARLRAEARSVEQLVVFRNLLGGKGKQKDDPKGLELTVSFAPAEIDSKNIEAFMRTLRTRLRETKSGRFEGCEFGSGSVEVIVRVKRLTDVHRIVRDLLREDPSLPRATGELTDMATLESSALDLRSLPQ